MTSQIKPLSLVKTTAAALALSGAMSFSAQASLLTNYGAYAATSTASNCPSYCTSDNGGEFAYDSEGGEFTDSAFATEVSYADTQAYAALNGSSYLPTLKVKTSAGHAKGGKAEAFAMQGYSYTASDATTIDLELDLHGSVGDNSSGIYANNNLRADVAVFIGDSLEWYADFATLYYEFAYDMEKVKSSLFIYDGLDEHDVDTLSFDLEPGQSFFVVASMEASSNNGYVDAWNTLNLNFDDDSNLVAASTGSAPVDVPEPASLGLLGLALSLISFSRNKKSA